MAKAIVNALTGCVATFHNDISNKPENERNMDMNRKWNTIVRMVTAAYLCLCFQADSGFGSAPNLDKRMGGPQPGDAPPRVTSPRDTSEQARYTQLLALAERQFAGADGGETISEAERRFFEAVSLGQAVDFSMDGRENSIDVMADPATADRWSASRVLRASRVVWLCVDPIAKKLITDRGINVTGCRIDGNLDLADADITTPLMFYKCAFPAGINLKYADLRSLVLEGSNVAPAAGVAISAHGLKVAKGLYLGKGFAAKGEVRLVGANIAGDLDLRNASLSNQKGFALNGEGISVGGNLNMVDGFAANGEINLMGAKIGGTIRCDGAQLSNEGGRAFTGTRMKVEGSVYLDGGFKARGEMRLPSAAIGGNLVCDGAEFFNPGGRALSADDLKVTGMFLVRDVKNKRDFRASGRVSLNGATLGTDLDCEGGKFSNPGDYAIMADGITVGRAVLLRNKFSADGRISFLSANLGRMLDYTGMENPQKTALDLRSARVMVLQDEENTWPPTIEMDAFLYEEIAEVCPKKALDRIRWLKRHPEFGARDWQQLGVDLRSLRENDPKWTELRVRYSPEVCEDWATLFKEWDDEKWSRQRRQISPLAYEQLASVLRRDGHEDEAREVLIEKNRRMAEEISFNWKRLGGRWWWYRFFGPLIGFGYETWRAFWGSVALVFLGWLICERSQKRSRIVATGAGAYLAGTSTLSPEYPPFHPLIYSLEIFVPLIKLGQAEFWRPAGSERHLQWYLWLHISAGWVLTTVWLAGLAGVLKT